LGKIPGCTKEMIELLLNLQKGGVQLSRPDELFPLLVLPASANEKPIGNVCFEEQPEGPMLPPGS